MLNFATSQKVTLVSLIAVAALLFVFIVVRARASDERDARIRSRSIATHRGVGDASDARERERIARDRFGSRATRAAVDDGEAATRWR